MAWAEVAAAAGVDAARLVRAPSGSWRRAWSWRARTRPGAPSERPAADIVIADDPACGDCDSDRRLRAAADRRSADRRRRRRARRLARHGRCACRTVAVDALHREFGSRPGGSGRRGRAVDRRVLLRSGARRARRLRGRGIRRARTVAVVYRRAPPDGRESVDAERRARGRAAPIIGSSTAGRLFVTNWRCRGSRRNRCTWPSAARPATPISARIDAMAQPLAAWPPSSGRGAERPRLAAALTLPAGRLRPPLPGAPLQTEARRRDD